MTAFTVAFQVPNLIRALVADMALQGAFVPVFSELLEKGKRREAFRVASSVIFLIILVLGAVTGLFILLAGRSCPCSSRLRRRAGLKGSRSTSRSSCSRSSSCWP